MQRITNPQHGPANTASDFDELDKLEVGMVIMVENPRRIAKIVRKGEAPRNFISGGEQVRRNVPVVYATVTIPTRAIEGYVSEETASGHEKSVEARYRRNEPDKPAQWEETWRSRSVHRVVTPEGAVARFTEGVSNLVSQIICENRTGYDSSRADGIDSYGVVNSVISGDILDPEIVPEGIFLSPKQRAARRDAAEQRKQGEIAQAAREKEAADKAFQMELATVGAEKMASAVAAAVSGSRPAEAAEVEALRARLAKAEAALAEKAANAPRKRGPNKKKAAASA